MAENRSRFELPIAFMASAIQTNPARRPGKDAKSKSSPSPPTASFARRVEDRRWDDSRWLRRARTPLLGRILPLCTAGKSMQNGTSASYRMEATWLRSCSMLLFGIKLLRQESIATRRTSPFNSCSLPLVRCSLLFTCDHANDALRTAGAFQIEISTVS